MGARATDASGEEEKLGVVIRSSSKVKVARVKVIHASKVKVSIRVTEARQPLREQPRLSMLGTQRRER